MYKTVYILIAEGFEEVEALTPLDLLRRVEINAVLVSCSDRLAVRGARGVKIVCDTIIDNLEDGDVEEAFGVILPGGLKGAENLRDSEGVKYILRDMMAARKMVAAICAAPIVLKSADVIEGRRITSYPGFEEQLNGAKYIDENIVIDGNLITSRGPALAMDFSLAIVEHLCGTEKRHSLAKELLYDLK